MTLDTFKKNFHLGISVIGFVTGIFATFVSITDYFERFEAIDFNLTKNVENYSTFLINSDSDEDADLILTNWDSLLTNNSKRPVTIQKYSVYLSTETSEDNVTQYSKSTINFPIEIEPYKSSGQFKIFIPIPLDPRASIVLKEKGRNPNQELQLSDVLKELNARRLDLFGNSVEEITKNEKFQIEFCTTRGKKFSKTFYWYDEGVTKREPVKKP